MNFLQELLRFLDTSMEMPGLFGWFHILWLGITAAATWAMCRFGKGKERKVMLWTAIVVIVLEVYKQVNYSFSYEGGIAFDYQWYAFPFQFCSTPMYIGLLAGITKPTISAKKTPGAITEETTTAMPVRNCQRRLAAEGKVHDALCCYLATFALFAGLCVMAYPGDVFTDIVGINIQTMICHGSMVAIGIYLLYTGYVKLEHKTILKAAAVFAVCVLLAVGLNELAHLSALEETFNMFFISPYWECTLPVYNLVHNVLPFPVNLLVYIAGFTAASWIILSAAILISKAPKKNAQCKMQNAKC